MKDTAPIGGRREPELADRFHGYNDWTIGAMTDLVNFAAITLEPAPLETIPSQVASFLARPLFDLSFIGLFRFDPATAQWMVLASHGAGDIDLDEVPNFEGNTLLEEDREIYSFFSILDEAFLVLVTRAPDRPAFSACEYSFMSLFSTLFSSFYQMKKLAKQVEEKIVEMSNLSASSKLIAGLRENTVTVEEVFLELADTLSLDAFALALCDDTVEKPHVVLARGIDEKDWDALLAEIYTDEKHFPDEWEMFSLFDENLVLFGAFICRLAKQNPTLYAIQRRVLDHTVAQVTTILSQRQFHTESLTDPLTGIANRRNIMKVLKERIRAARLDPLTKLSVAMIDIDHFKKVNDTYGHQAGDAVLKAVAQAVASALRGTDLAGRYGGEEFLVVMQAGRKGAYHVSERIRRNIAKLRIKTGGHTLSVTASVGYAVCTGLTISPEEIIARADAFLYQAKEAGRDRTVGDRPEEEG